MSTGQCQALDIVYKVTTLNLSAGGFGHPCHPVITTQRDLEPRHLVEPKESTLDWGMEVVETDPDSLTTGAWSNPFSRRMAMVCSQVTVGSTVSGADKLSS